MSVTLLFTDIEDSTRLVRERGSAYPATLDAYRRRVRAAVGAAREAGRKYISVASEILGETV